MGRAYTIGIDFQNYKIGANEHEEAGLLTLTSNNIIIIISQEFIESQKHYQLLKNVVNSPSLNKRYTIFLLLHQPVTKNLKLNFFVLFCLKV